jgi:hypothetical protein
MPRLCWPNCSANLADKARKIGIPVWRFTAEPAATDGAS